MIYFMQKLILKLSLHIDSDILITGEWCQTVLEDFNVQTEGFMQIRDHSNAMHAFRGRGIQYYLGFHKGSTTCKGHIRLTDCHYLSSLLGSKILGGYYLGCPMTSAMKDALFHIFRKGIYGDTDTDGNDTPLVVRKV